MSFFRTKNRLRGHFEVENTSAARSCGDRPQASALIGANISPTGYLVIVIDINDTAILLWGYVIDHQF